MPIQVFHTSDFLDPEIDIEFAWRDDADGPVFRALLHIKEVSSC